MPRMAPARSTPAGGMRSVHGGFAACACVVLWSWAAPYKPQRLIWTPAGYVLLPHAPFNTFIPKLKARRSDLSPLRLLGLLLSPFHLLLPSVPPHLPGLPERELSVRRVEHAAGCFPVFPKKSTDVASLVPALVQRTSLQSYKRHSQ